MITSFKCFSLFVNSWLVTSGEKNIFFRMYGWNVEINLYIRKRRKKQNYEIWKRTVKHMYWVLRSTQSWYERTNRISQLNAINWIWVSCIVILISKHRDYCDDHIHLVISRILYLIIILDVFNSKIEDILYLVDGCVDEIKSKRLVLTAQFLVGYVCFILNFSWATYGRIQRNILRHSILKKKKKSIRNYLFVWFGNLTQYSKYWPLYWIEKGKMAGFEIGTCCFCLSLDVFWLVFSTHVLICQSLARKSWCHRILFMVS